MLQDGSSSYPGRNAQQGLGYEVADALSEYSDQLFVLNGGDLDETQYLSNPSSAITQCVRC